jgi:fatty-acyl-CoA synthase
MPAYNFPLIIKQLLLTPLAHETAQEIVYRGGRRYGYRTLRERIGRLGSSLKRLGVKPADTVAVMDWDSHRYLECYFAVPMLGAVLQTVNVRLSTGADRLLPQQRGGIGAPLQPRLLADLRENPR